MIDRDAADVATWWFFNDDKGPIEVACGICPAGALGWSVVATRGDIKAKTVLWRYLATHLIMAHETMIDADLPDARINRTAEVDGPPWRFVDTWKTTTQARKTKTFAALIKWSNDHPDWPRLDVVGL